MPVDSYSLPVPNMFILAHTWQHPLFARNFGADIPVDSNIPTPANGSGFVPCLTGWNNLP